MKNSEHLQWIFNRLVEVHGENPNYDYMHRFREIINDVKENETGWLCKKTLTMASSDGVVFTKGKVYQEYDYEPLTLIDDEGDQHEIGGEWEKYFEEIR